jgi:hypothetical protein
MAIIGILALDIYLENFSRSAIAELELEATNFPELAGEILGEIAIVSTIGMVFLVTAIVFIVTAVLFVYIGIKKNGNKKK